MVWELRSPPDSATLRRRFVMVLNLHRSHAFTARFEWAKLRPAKTWMFLTDSLQALTVTDLHSTPHLALPPE